MRDSSPSTAPEALPAVLSLDSPDALQALSHPTRVRMLEALHEPASAAALGRQLGQPRQRINYHLKALEDAALVRRVGTRRQGNFTETLYRAAARSFVISPRAVWWDPRRAQALHSQHALRELVALGEALQCDALALLDRAAFEDEQIPSAAVSAEVRFSSQEERAAFMREYLELTRALVERYEARSGDAYRVVLAVHPRAERSLQ